MPIKNDTPSSRPSLNSRTTATPDGNMGYCEASCCDRRVEDREVVKQEPQSKNTTVPKTQEGPKQLDVEFLFLDLTNCDRCRQAEAQLTQALQELRPVLETEDISSVIHHIHIQNERHAAAAECLISPTIRLNGRDLQPNWNATVCEPCEGLCGAGEAVRCREWWYRGHWYASPPKGLLCKAILEEVYDRNLSPPPLPSGTSCCE